MPYLEMVLIVCKTLSKKRINATILTSRSLESFWNFNTSSDFGSYLALVYSSNSLRFLSYKASALSSIVLHYSKSIYFVMFVINLKSNLNIFSTASTDSNSVYTSPRTSIASSMIDCVWRPLFESVSFSCSPLIASEASLFCSEVSSLSS